MYLDIKTLADYHQIYDRSLQNPELFWKQIAEKFDWYKKPSTICSGDLENANVKWFEDGQLNITYNCLDRHLEDHPNDIAFIFEANEPGETSLKLSYRELYNEVNKLANGLKSIGVKKGDKVCIYMPLIPEAIIAMLAAARIGAVHSVVFGGFSAQSLESRINDCAAKVVITADELYRGNKLFNLKETVDEAVKNTSSVEKIILLNRNPKTQKTTNKDVFWNDLVNDQRPECEPAVMNAEDPLFILYTSGSTGKPKGIVHTCGGYMVYAGYTHQTVFNYKKGDVFWCTADVGWITGHTYITYGPLLNGATTVLYEGVPSYPDPGRFWEIIEKHKVNIFYTAPTAIRALQREGDEWPSKYNLSSLKVIGTVGEPINVEAWEWYNTHVGKEKCTIVDTWWQTETGGIMISPIPDVTPVKPGFATLPLPGIVPCLMDDQGNELEGINVSGNLCIKQPWPSIARTINGDHQRFINTYLSAYKGKYFTGDGARRDEDGYYRITGRVDDIIIVSGHNLGTAEIESALDEHEAVVESAVIGYPHDIKGQGIYAFVITKKKIENEIIFKDQLLKIVTEKIGALAKPDKIQIVSDLPKTRSGKIMRRILRKIAEGETDLGDTSTLLNPTIAEEIRKGNVI
jgi:acetyl-CoA synthetase